MIFKYLCILVPRALCSRSTLTAVWSKAPPLTVRCLSPLSGFESRPGHVRKLPVTWGQAVVFAGYSGFLHYLQLASHELATIGINVTKNKIQIQIPCALDESRLRVNMLQ